MTTVACLEGFEVHPPPCEIYRWHAACKLIAFQVWMEKWKENTSERVSEFWNYYFK